MEQMVAVKDFKETGRPEEELKLSVAFPLMRIPETSTYEIV